MGVARKGERRCLYRILVGKPRVKRPLGRYRRRREGNIKMDLQGVGSMNWIDLAQDRVGWREIVNVVIKLRLS
jgi:hypothetical protein